jgi:hypothetical protein
MHVASTGAGIPTLQLSNSNTTTQGYTQMAYVGTGRSYFTGVGNASETSFGVANKYYLFDQTANAMRMVVDSTGNVGIGTTSPDQRLQVGASGDGSVAVANAWNTFSDATLKRDLAVLPDALDKLLALHGYYYFWREGTDQSRQVGVIAQEVEKVLPELVHTSGDGVKTVDYPKLTALLIESTRALKAQKDAEIAQLKAESALLKAALCAKFPDLSVCGDAPAP